MKTKLIITEQSDYRRPKEGVFRFSNTQYLADQNKLEGFEFGDVIIKTKPHPDLAKWLHMHLGIRVDRIIYESPFKKDE